MGLAYSDSFKITSCVGSFARASTKTLSFCGIRWILYRIRVRTLYACDEENCPKTFFDSLTSYTSVGNSPYKTAGVHVLHIWFSDFCFWWFANWVLWRSFKCKIDWTQHDSTARRQFAPGHAGHKSHLPREAALGRFCSWTLRDIKGETIGNKMIEASNSDIPHNLTGTLECDSRAREEARFRCTTLL